MQQRVLITGVNGFTGRHLAERLARESRYVLLGTGRRLQSDLPLDGYFCCDLTNPKPVARLLAWAQPDIVYHLAGVLGGTSEEELWRVNVMAFVTLCDALARLAKTKPIRLLAVGSAAELGSAAAALSPVTEDAVCRPETSYGRSKHEQILHALSRGKEGPLEIVVARPFNLVGPGLDGRTALGQFALQLSAIRRGECDTLRCGPLSARRDFLDIRDAVEAYILAALYGSTGEIYNVCSGRSWQIGDLLSMLIELSELAVNVEEAPCKGSTDLLDIYGDAGKLTQLTDWRPRVPLAQSLRQLLESAGALLSSALS